MSRLAPLSRNRFRLICNRWISMLWCGAVAAAVCLLIDPAVRAVGAPLINRLSTLSPLLLSAVLLTLTSTAVFFAASGRWHGFLGVRYCLVYPPIWMAVVAGLAAWLTAGACFNGFESTKRCFMPAIWFAQALPTIVSVAIGTLAGVALLFGASSRRRATQRVHDYHADPVTGAMAGDDTAFHELCSWIRNDAEITSPHEDRFGHDGVARRMAARLSMPGEAPTMALVGPLGSGKTTIRCLVEHHLSDNPMVRLVSVSLWPFDCPEAAVRGILRALVRELGRHVNVLSLVGLSDDYVTAIERTAGSYGGIARLLRGASDPHQILNRLSDITCSAGLRIVLWVEDLERFSGGDSFGEPARSEREVERLGPIRALLYLLDRCPHISVVISDTSLRTRFDVSKIARFVEQAPALSREHVRNCVKMLRDACLGDNTVIDPTIPTARAEFEKPEQASKLSEWFLSFRDSKPNLILALTTVLETPRALKTCLRMTLETWERMPGEIEFDSVLVASALRVSWPDLFTLVADHIALFRHGLHDPFSLTDDKELHPVSGHLARLLEEAGQHGASFTALLTFLFPAYSPDSKDLALEPFARPQSFFASGHADYWRRYMTLNAPVDGQTDQDVLRSIAAWRANTSSDLVERFTNQEQIGQVQDFSAQFDGDDLCRLLVEVARRIQTEPAANWEHGYLAPGVVSIWHMMLRDRPASSAVASTVEQVIQDSIGVHLPLSFCVWYCFAKRDTKGPALISDEQCDHVKQVIRDALVKTASGPGGPNSLTRALRGGPLWLLPTICRDLGFIGEGGNALTCGGWHDLSGTLLRLAEEQPEVGVPLIVPLFTTATPKDRVVADRLGPRVVTSWVANCDLSNAKQLFDETRLIRLLESFVLSDGLDEPLRAMCLAAVKAAQDTLNPAVVRDTREAGPLREPNNSQPIL